MYWCVKTLNCLWGQKRQCTDIYISEFLRLQETEREHKKFKERGGEGLQHELTATHAGSVARPLHGNPSSLVYRGV